MARAVAQARDEILRQPKSADAWGMLGKILIANQMWENSLVCLQQAERLDGKPLWLNYQGIALFSLGRTAEAAAKLRQALILWQRDGQRMPLVRLRLAKALLDLGRVDESEQEFRLILEDEPKQGPAHFGLAQIAYERQDWMNCRGHLETCLDDSRTRQQACTQLPPICLRLGDKESAARYEARARQLPPDVPSDDPLSPFRLHPELGETTQNVLRTAMGLRAAGRFGEAAKVLRPLADKNPHDFRPQLLLGRTLQAQGDFQAGQQFIRQAIRLAPDQFDPHYFLAVALLNEGKALLQAGEKEKAARLFEEASQSARRALEINPASGFAHAFLGLSLKYLGKRDEALAALRQAVHCNPEAWEPHLDLGIALAENGQPALARLEFEQANRLNPRDPRPAGELKKLNERSRP